MLELEQQLIGHFLAGDLGKQKYGVNSPADLAIYERVVRGSAHAISTLNFRAGEKSVTNFVAEHVEIVHRWLQENMPKTDANDLSAVLVEYEMIITDAVIRDMCFHYRGMVRASNDN